VKSIIIILMIILSLSLASAISETDCDKVFFFLVENGGHYTNEDLKILEEEVNISLESLSDSLLNYSGACNKTLPFKSVVGVIEVNKSIKGCDVDIDKKLFWGAYDLDTSIPIPEIFTNSLNCDSVGNWKWLFKLKNNGKTFSIKGIKFYVLLFPLVTAGLIYAIIDTRRTNSVFKSYFKRNNLNTLEVYN